MEEIKEWDENVDISWWKVGRTKLNKVIRKYNKWVRKHTEDEVKTTKLLVKIEKHLKKDYCNNDGGSAYKEELLKMKENVKKCFNLFI